MAQQRTEDTLRTIQQARTELERLEQSLKGASSIQWEKSLRPRLEQGEPRGKGSHSDPTGEAAVDDRRLALRTAVRAADQVASRILVATTQVRSNLDKATRRWSGEFEG